MATSWVSKDKSKPYYDQTVTTNSSGSIVPVSSSSSSGSPSKSSKSSSSSGGGSSPLPTYTLPDGSTTTNQAIYNNAIASQQQKAMDISNSPFVTGIAGPTQPVSVGTKPVTVFDYKTIQDSSGNIVAVQDPVKQMSYAAPSGQAFSPGSIASASKQANTAQVQQTPYIAPQLDTSSDKTWGLGGGGTLQNSNAVYGTVFGTSSAISSPTALFTESANRLTQQYQTTSEPVSKIGVGMAAFEVSVAAGALSVITNPIGTGKGILQTFVHPISSMEQLGAGLAASPITTAGQLVGQSLVIGGALKAAEPFTSRIPAPHYESVNLPTSAGDATIYRGFVIGDKPLIGIQEGRITAGYKVPSVEYAPKDFIPTTPFETRMSVDLAKTIYSPTEVSKISLSMDLARETQFTKSIYNSGLPIETRTLPEAGTKIVNDFIKQNDATAYGSYIAQAQLPLGAIAKGRGMPINEPAIGDIDVQLKLSEADTVIKTNFLASRLKAAGINARVSSETPTLIETNVGKNQWAHAVDIHSIDKPLDMNLPLEGAYGFKFGQKAIKIEGEKVMPLSEFGLRKMGSSLMQHEEGVSPLAHRMKDIPDFLTSQEYLLKSKGAGAESFKKLGELSDIYRSEGKITEFGPTKVKMYEPFSRSVSGGSQYIAGFSLPSISALSSMRSASIKTSLKTSSLSLSYSPLKFRSPSASLASSSISSMAAPYISGSFPSMSRSNMYYAASSRSVSSLASPSMSLPSLSPSFRYNSISASPYLSGSSTSSMPKISRSLSPSIASPSLSIPVTTLPSLPSMPSFNFQEQGGRRRGKGARWKPKYMPSLESTFFGIHGKANTFQASTGLFNRPIA